MRSLTRKILLLESSYFVRKNYLKSLKRNKRFQVHPITAERKYYGEFQHLHNSLLEFPEKFKEYYRMSRETFEYILKEISSTITKKTRNKKIPIDAAERLSLTLR